MVLEKYQEKNMRRKEFVFCRNKFICCKRCKKNGIKFGITYHFNEKLQDTCYYLHDFSREYRDSVVGEFYNRNLDLLFDICSWLNWREENDHSGS